MHGMALSWGHGLIRTRLVYMVAPVKLQELLPVFPEIHGICIPLYLTETTQLHFIWMVVVKLLGHLLADAH